MTATRRRAGRATLFLPYPVKLGSPLVAPAAGAWPPVLPDPSVVVDSVVVDSVVVAAVVVAAVVVVVVVTVVDPFVPVVETVCWTPVGSAPAVRAAAPAPRPSRAANAAPTPSFRRICRLIGTS